MPGKAASSDQAAHGAHEAPGSARLRACFLGARGAIGGTSDARGAGRFVGFVGSLGGGVANPLADTPLTGNPLSGVLVDTVIRPLAPVLVSRYAARLVGLGATLGLAIGLPAGGQATRYLGVAVGWSEVRAAAVVPGVCARVAGRVRLHRSEGLKTSHGSRLFMGERPTGEDNAARAAGPPTG